jgi:hypothetical protein
VGAKLLGLNSAARGDSLSGAACFACHSIFLCHFIVACHSIFLCLSFPKGICVLPTRKPHPKQTHPNPRHLDRSEAQRRDPCISLLILLLLLLLPPATNPLKPHRGQSVCGTAEAVPLTELDIIGAFLKQRYRQVIVFGFAQLQVLKQSPVQNRL